jgi:hypothetical protein
MKKRNVSVITNLVLVIGLLSVGVTAYADKHDKGEFIVDTIGSKVTNNYGKSKVYTVEERSYDDATFIDIRCRDHGTRLYTPQNVRLTCHDADTDCRLDQSLENRESTTGLTFECKDPRNFYIEQVSCDPTKEITAEKATLHLSENCK